MTTEQSTPRQVESAEEERQLADKWASEEYPRWKKDERFLVEEAFLAGLREGKRLREGEIAGLKKDAEFYKECHRCASQALGEAIKTRDSLAIDCLAELSAAGIPTPVEGYKDAPQFLAGDIQKLVKQRDAARTALALSERKAQRMRSVLEKISKVPNRQFVDEDVEDKIEMRRWAMIAIIGEDNSSQALETQSAGEGNDE